MKITGTGPQTNREISGSGSAGAATSVGNSKGRRTSIAPEIDSGSDNVAISGRAKDALKAKEIAKSSPDIDEAKVARLKAAIQNGSYKVDADKVADRLVDEHMMSSF